MYLGLIVDNSCESDLVNRSAPKLNLVMKCVLDGVEQNPFLLLKHSKVDRRRGCVASVELEASPVFAAR